MVIENFDENALRNRKDSLINPLANNMKFENDEHVNELQNQMQ